MVLLIVSMEMTSTSMPYTVRFEIEITSEAGEPSLLRHVPLHSSGSLSVGAG